MKKTVRFMLVLLAVVLLAGCGQKRDSNLKAIVEQENASCPYELEEGVTITKVEQVSDGTVAFFITLGENFGSLLDDNVGKETLKVGLLHWFTDSDSPFTEVVDAVIDEYGTLGCAFQNADGKKWKCEYQSYELESAREENNSPVVDADEDEEAEEVAEEEAALPAREETPSYDQLVNSNGDELDSMSDEMLEEVLKLGISQADNNMPMDLGSGLTMKSIRLQGSNLLYTVECDEDQIPVELLEVAKDEMKKSMIEMVKTGDSDMKFICKALVKTHRGMDFKYVGDTSGESVTVHLTTNEIKRAIGL